MNAWLDRLLRWRDPAAKNREFAETEAFGGADLLRAAGRVEDPWMRRQLLRHADDEVRHAALLGGAETARHSPLGAALAGDTEAREGVDIDALGDVGFVAFVHVSEAIATAQFERAGAVNAENAAIYASILADERRHVAWTARALERFRERGRGAEVDAALSRERWRVRLVPLRWLAGRLADGVSAIVLTLLYYVALLPFSRLAPAPVRGWQPVPPSDLDREA